MLVLFLVAECLVVAAVAYLQEKVSADGVGVVDRDQVGVLVFGQYRRLLEAVSTLTYSPISIELGLEEC